jgi:DNA-binding winged helix-turn-helix (wHTH) protein/TolB-like protein
MNRKSEPPLPFHLRDRLVTPQRNSIIGPEGETGVEPKIMAVLCVLASEPGRVFTRSELIDQVWGTEYGADESLTRAVSHLRKALGDTRGEPLVIETISKRGYRLLPSALSSPQAQLEPPRNRRALIVAAGVTAIAGVAAGLLLERIHPRRGAEAPPSGIAVIVLPFNPVRREPQDISLATALTVDLVGALARDKHLHVTVKSPDAARPPPTGPRYSIYADIQTEAGHAKAMVEIMNFDTGQALWSRRYDQAYDGSIAAQDRLSALIARDLTPALLAMPQPKKPG